MWIVIDAAAHFLFTNVLTLLYIIVQYRLLGGPLGVHSPFLTSVRGRYRVFCQSGPANSAINTIVYTNFFESPIWEDEKARSVYPLYAFCKRKIQSQILIEHSIWR